MLKSFHFIQSATLCWNQRSFCFSSSQIHQQKTISFLKNFSKGGKIFQKWFKYSPNVETEQGRQEINYTRMDAVSFQHRKIRNKLRRTLVLPPVARKHYGQQAYYFFTNESDTKNLELDQSCLQRELFSDQLLSLFYLTFPYGEEATHNKIELSLRTGQYQN